MLPGMTRERGEKRPKTRESERSEQPAVTRDRRSVPGDERDHGGTTGPRAPRALTDAAIRASAPRASGVFELADASVVGLALRVTPNGAKTWAFRYRVAGQRRRISLGRWPDVSLSDARVRARKHSSAAADGKDPSRMRAEARSAMRMADLFGTDGTDGKDREPGWYLGTYVRGAGRNRHGKSAASITTDRLYIRKHLRARKDLMRLPTRELTVEMLAEIKHDMRSTPGAWRKVRAILRIALRHAVERGELARNLADDSRLKPTSEKWRERALDDEEWRQLWATIDSSEIADAYKRLFRLLMLTGMRRGEGMALRWEQIDMRQHVIRLPETKTGPRTVPLSAEAAEFLKSERGAVGRLGFVCATEDGRPLQNVERAWRALLRRARLDAVEGRERLRIHDLRRSWATQAINAGVPIEWIAKALGQTTSYVTMRYARLRDDAGRKAADAAGKAIAGVLGQR